MANYTEDEVQAAVEKIVRSTVRHPTGILGDRQVNTSFSDLQEAAAGVYILYFNAPFYTVMLGASRLKDLVQAQASTIAALLDAVFVTDRLVTPISDISALANAKAALLELESAVSGRTQGFSDIEKVPAFRRYAQNIDTFLATAGPNIKGSSIEEAGAASSSSAGSGAGQSIVDTPSGARLKIPSLARDMASQHGELIRRAKLLANALDDFASLNLPRIAAQGVISRARDVLDQHFTALSALDENSRLDDLRAVVLDLLTQRPLVEKYGAAMSPSEFITTKGLGVGFSDATHLATPAFLDADSTGPLPLLEGNNTIRFTMDGGAPYDYPLPIAYVAEITGIIAEPYLIDTDRDSLLVEFGDPDGITSLFSVALSNGSAQSAATVAADFNAAFGSSDLRCKLAFYPLKYSGPMTVTSIGPTSARFSVLGGSLSGLTIAAGDHLDVETGPNAGTWAVTAVDPGGIYVDTVSTTAVTSVPVGLPGISVEIGAARRVLKLVDTNPLASVTNRRRIKLLGTTGEYAYTASVFGWYPGMESRSRPVAAKDIASNIANSTSKLTAEAVLRARYTGTARSDTTDASKVVLSLFESDGVVTAGLNVIFNSALSVVGIEAGDLIVIRSSTTAANVGLEGAVVSFTDNSIVAAFNQPVVAGTCSFEVGPGDLFNFGDVLQIESGPNQGRYVVREDPYVGTTCGFELLLEQALPVPRDGADPLRFDVSFGGEFVRFKSRLGQVSSEVRVENAPGSSAAEYFFMPFDLPASARGTTPYLQFQNYPSGVAIDDLVELYEHQYNLASRAFNIIGLEPSSRLLKIDPEIESTASFSFDFDVPNPFGRVRVVQAADYATFKARLEAWVGLAEQQDSYFRDLARFLNPLLTNQNPSTADVNTAVVHLKKCLALLTVDGAAAYGAQHVPTVEENETLEFALNDYVAPVEEPVDTLLATFRNKGSDRAIDLLVEGQFSTFFGLDADGVSYSGTLMKSLRELAREDLPIRKTNRRDTAGQRLIGTIPEEKDFEFTADDADSPDNPDIPVGADVASPGENY